MIRNGPAMCHKEPSCDSNKVSPEGSKGKDQRAGQIIIKHAFLKGEIWENVYTSLLRVILSRYWTTACFWPMEQSMKDYTD